MITLLGLNPYGLDLLDLTPFTPPGSIGHNEHPPVIPIPSQWLETFPGVFLRFHLANYCALLSDH